MLKPHSFLPQLVCQLPSKVDELVGIAEQLAGRIDLVDIAHVGVVVVGDIDDLLILPHHEGGAGVWQGAASVKEVAKEL